MRDGDMAHRVAPRLVARRARLAGILPIATDDAAGLALARAGD